MVDDGTFRDFKMLRYDHPGQPLPVPPIDVRGIEKRFGITVLIAIMFFTLAISPASHLGLLTAEGAIERDPFALSAGDARTFQAVDDCGWTESGYRGDFSQGEVFFDE